MGPHCYRGGKEAARVTRGGRAGGDSTAASSPQGTVSRCGSMATGGRRGGWHAGRPGGESVRLIAEGLTMRPTVTADKMGRLPSSELPNIAQATLTCVNSTSIRTLSPHKWRVCGTFGTVRGGSPFHWGLLVLLIGSALLPTCKPEAETAGTASDGTSGSDPLSYGIVIDAGSSGTRMRIYQWRESVDCTRLPEFREATSKKITPGISAFQDSLEELGDYLTQLLDYGKEHVPTQYHSATPIYVMATAGMRLLLEPNANAVMNKINSLMLDASFSPFMYESRNTRILSGEEEGSFAWLAVNYLIGVFSGEGVESAGILELGGASTQIAFLPDGAILADKWPMQIAKRPYALYVHSYLYYGQELTVMWAKQYLVRTAPGGATFIINPCMLTGDNRTETIDGRQVTFIGTSNPDGCQKIVDVFVYKAADYNCHPKPCAISTVYQPTIDPEKQFYALSAFLFNLRDISALDEGGHFTPAGALTAARAYCTKTFSQVKEEIGGKEDFLSSNCLMGLYMPTLFTKGYGFAEDSQQIIAVKKLKGTSLEWSLGAIIYEHQRKDRICHPRESAVCASSGQTVLVPHLLGVLGLLVFSLRAGLICHPQL